MRIHSFLLILAVGIATILQAGCGGSGGSSSGPQTIGSSSGSCCSFGIYTQQVGGGVWANAQLRGTADPFTISCNPGTDSNCLTQFGPISDLSDGEAIVYTDALPAYWTVMAAPDTNCNDGASSGDESITSDGSIYLTCGQADPVGANAEPSDCTVTYVNGSLYEGCGPDTELITDSPLTLPTSYALDVDYYDLYGDWLGDTTATAANSTEINVPIPSNWGISVITLTDPTTSDVLAGVSYTLHQCDVTINPPNSSTNCPY